MSIREVYSPKENKVSAAWGKMDRRLLPKLLKLMPNVKSNRDEFPCDAMMSWNMTTFNLRWSGRWTEKQIELLGDMVELLLDQLINLAEPPPGMKLPMQ